MASIAERWNKIEAMLNEGKTVYFCTAYKILKVTKKTLDQGLIKFNGKEMLVRRGKHWDCLNYCAVRVDA